MNRSAYIRLYRHVDTYIFYDRPYVYIIHIIYTMLLGQKFHPQTQSQLSNAGNLPKAHADWMGLSLASSKEEARCEKTGGRDSQNFMQPNGVYLTGLRGVLFNRFSLG